MLQPPEVLAVFAVAAACAPLDGGGSDVSSGSAASIPCGARWCAAAAADNDAVALAAGGAATKRDEAASPRGRALRIGLGALTRRSREICVRAR